MNKITYKKLAQKMLDTGHLQMEKYLCKNFTVKVGGGHLLDRLIFGNLWYFDQIDATLK